MMVAKCSILLTILSVNIFNVASLFESCDLVQNLTVTSRHVFQSTNYSDTNRKSKYLPGSSCRIRYVAPKGYYVRLIGSISLDRNVNVYLCNDQGQKFLVSRDGMQDFYNNDLFCSTDSISINSISNEMTVGYTSDMTGAGRFKLIASIAKFNVRNCDCGWGYYSFQQFNKDSLFKGFTSVVGVYHEESDAIICTGVIVSRRYIISSAHCYQNDAYKPATLSILAGYKSYPSDDFPQYQETYKIASIKIHENYDKLSPGQLDDIVMIKTTDDIKFTRGVSPICIPSAKVFMNEQFYLRKTFDLVGFNKYNNDGEQQILQNATVNSYPISNCSQLFPLFNMTKSQVCTYEGDTYFKFPEYPGALLIYTASDRKYLVGLFNLLVNHTQPLAYTRVASYMTWIRNATDDDLMCNRFY